MNIQLQSKYTSHDSTQVILFSIPKAKRNAPPAANGAQLHLFRGTATAMAMA